MTSLMAGRDSRVGDGDDLAVAFLVGLGLADGEEEAKRSSLRITLEVTVYGRNSTPSSGTAYAATATTRDTTVASSFAKSRASASMSAVGRRASNAASSIPPLSMN